jgi:hypothetical protein
LKKTSPCKGHVGNCASKVRNHALPYSRKRRLN